MVASIPRRACLDVTTCEIHLRGVGVLDTHLSLDVGMLALLALWHLFGFLHFYASFHAWLHIQA